MPHHLVERVEEAKEGDKPNDDHFDFCDPARIESTTQANSPKRYPPEYFSGVNLGGDLE
jgi:hypothetical protein